jgi:hypothetical protein
MLTPEQAAEVIYEAQRVAIQQFGVKPPAQNKRRQVATLTACLQSRVVMGPSEDPITKIENTVFDALSPALYQPAAKSLAAE